MWPEDRYVTRQPLHGAATARADATATSWSSSPKPRAKEFRGTELVELDEPAAKSAAFLDGSCDAVAKGNGLAFVCLDEPDATAAYVHTGKEAPNRIDVDLGGRIVEFHAVALEGGILMAWTVETSDGFALRAVVVQVDGHALSNLVALSPEPVVPRFDLERDAADVPATASPETPGTIFTRGNTARRALPRDVGDRDHPGRCNDLARLRAPVP